MAYKAVKQEDINLDIEELEETPETNPASRVWKFSKWLSTQMLVSGTFSLFFCLIFRHFLIPTSDSSKSASSLELIQTTLVPFDTLGDVGPMKTTLKDSETPASNQISKGDVGPMKTTLKTSDTPAPYQISKGDAGLRESSSSFCYEGHLLPSLIGIGVQKCGTTTLNKLLMQVEAMSNGHMKGHHFFDHPDLMSTHMKKFINDYPTCDSQIQRTYDITPNYTHPGGGPPKYIKEFYDERNLPTDDIIFIASICDPANRLKSAYFYTPSDYQIHTEDGSVIKKDINRFIDYMLSSFKRGIGDITKPGIFLRGHYDDIFGRYFDLFPRNKFVFVNSYYLYKNEKEFVRKIAEILDIDMQEEKKIKYAWANMQNWHKKQPIEEEKRQRLDEHFAAHTERFIRMINQRENVFMMPDQYFFANGGINSNFSKNT